jgi:ATP-binding cassette subfamily B protein
MGKLFKNMAPYWKSVIVVFCLLIIQAYCDLSLPQYTSNIIDVGIINGGVEHILPDKITEDTYQMVSLLMTDEEREAWENSFTQEGSSYVAKDLSEEELEELDEQLLVPMILAYQVKNSEEVDIEQMMQMVQSGNVAWEQVQRMLELARNSVDRMIETTGESTLKSQALQFTTACNEEAGLDVDQIQISYLMKSGLKMLLLALLMGVVTIFVGLFASRVGAGVGRDLRQKVFTKVMGFSNAEMDHFSAASLITRSTNDIQQVQMVSTMLLRMVLYAPIMGVGGIIKVLHTNASMGWTIALSVLVIMGFVMLLVSVTMPKFKIMQTLVDRVNLVSREILTGLSVIRAFGREQKEEERFDEANRDLMKTQLFTNRTMSVMMPGMMIIMNGTAILITWVAAHKIDMGTLQVGAMTAFITYSMQIVMSFLMLTMMSIMLPRAGVAAERIDQVIKTESSIVDKEDVIPFQAKEGVVKYDHVYFAYPDAKEDVLSDIDFEAKPGEVTAIIGSTGCGKSTLVNLLPRFYDVRKGAVTIDGIDIRDISKKELRESIGFVPQKGVLFSGTIASNLRFGKHDASDEEIKEAAEIAQAMEFIEEKKKKFDSEIAQGGSNVSGGQKQRLAIARAIVKKPKILVFDDSFSALDMKTDAVLRKALLEKVKDSTVLIVAQRISTILHADRIIVLDDGQIVGMGTHEELLHSCEVYEQIARSQLSAKELGLEEKEA